MKDPTIAVITVGTGSVIFIIATATKHPREVVQYVRFVPVRYGTVPEPYCTAANTVKKILAFMPLRRSNALYTVQYSVLHLLQRYCTYDYRTVRAVSRSIVRSGMLISHLLRNNTTYTVFVIHFIRTVALAM